MLCKQVSRLEGGQTGRHNMTPATSIDEAVGKLKLLVVHWLSDMLCDHTTANTSTSALSVHLSYHQLITPPQFLLVF